MDIDRTLVNAIKQNFANRPSAELHEAAQATDEVRWSIEAVTAAREVLADRAEPRAPKPPYAPPPDYSPPPLSPLGPWGIFHMGLSVLGILLGVFTGRYIVYLPKKENRT